MKKRISVVDDDGSMRSMYDYFLKEKYVVELFESMHDFLNAQAKKIKEGNSKELPDLIVSDKNLGVKKKVGCKYMEMMHNDSYLSNIPRIMVTSDYEYPCCTDCYNNLRKFVKGCHNKREIDTGSGLLDLVERYIL